VFLTGAEKRTVSSATQTIKLVNEAIQNRAVAATQMNDVSSRSHCILTFYIDSKPATSFSSHEDVSSILASSVVSMGKLHLVDLAGSERLSRSGVEGEAQKEAQNINSSLTALGDVLFALSSGSSSSSASATPTQIPYRNSKLTRLLQDSLGGNSRTFFIINVSSAPENYRESLMSLQYGQRAKKVKNTTSVNKDLSLLRSNGAGGMLGTASSVADAIEAVEAIYKRELESVNAQIKEKDDEVRSLSRELALAQEELRVAKSDKVT